MEPVPEITNFAKCNPLTANVRCEYCYGCHVLFIRVPPLEQWEQPPGWVPRSTQTEGVQEQNEWMPPDQWTPKHQHDQANQQAETQVGNWLAKRQGHL